MNSSCAPIGMILGQPCELVSIDLFPGDVLVFYTDGVTEAENLLAEEFGMERLSGVVQRGSSLSAEALMSDIFNSAANFSKDVGFSDDVTILVVKCDFDRADFIDESNFGAKACELESPVQLSVFSVSSSAIRKSTSSGKTRCRPIGIPSTVLDASPRVIRRTNLRLRFLNAPIFKYFLKFSFILRGGIQSASSSSEGCIMWIVKLALSRPYTFVVASIFIVILGALAIVRTPTDIFPNINIPVVSIIWNYNGMVPEDISDRIVSVTERALTTTVDNIEHVESQSLYGIAVVKVFLQPTANIQQGIAQITAVSQTQLKQLPAGSTPPLILAYSASSVPVLQLALSGQNLSEQELNDYGLNFIRTQLITVPGASVPYPYGGKQRQVQVDLNTTALQSKGLSALDVVNAISVQNLILPTGTSKIGSREYNVSIPNAAPQTIADLNRIPIKTVGGTTIYIKDVAWVRDGFPPQTNIVRVNGQRSVLLTIQKAGNASTLNVIAGIKALLPQIKTTVPPQLDIAPLADQSIFVRGAISGVVRETLIAACLTAFMILAFLGSWRSTLIIATSIPLAILTSIIVFSAIGETINIMTLGGLALAVGILVDDATVEVENINRNREAEPEKDMDAVVLDSASQIATPAFVSTLSICIVFAPMFLLSGVARYLFVPLAEAVVFAMLASYLLSRTIVPTMAKYLLRGEKHEAGTAKPQPACTTSASASKKHSRNSIAAIASLLEVCLHHRRAFLIAFFACCLGSLAILIPWLGRDFFPSVDSGSFKLHLRAPTGMRIEETANLCDQVERFIRGQIPASEFQSVIDNIGLPYSGINLSYSNSAPVGTSDADILVTLSAKHHPTDDYVQRLRLTLPKQFPGATFSFLPADMVSQILNFGLPAPIDVQVVGNDLEGNHRYADALLAKLKYVTGTADLRIQQPFDQPYLRLRVERTQSGATWFHCSRYRAKSSRVAQWQLPDFTNILGRPQESSQLSNCYSNAAISYGHTAGCREHPHHRHRPECSSVADGQFGCNATRRRNGGGLSLQRSPGGRHLWRCHRTRSGWRSRRHQQNH